ncbi:RagB/SusD family nutrient uptake outer membrane protein [Chitinophaga pendula]|uniref:RagB/SusD family nutrient uptake outer membrane protein n=1 Tax=Chitinophaga TaxID=79328 RepID=UPI000BAFD047|nr:MULTISPECIES: RagB/SusD family nutrient uptake outer membrane protein [Chitinophaga]ASZ13401.1 RagB/SusD family nutrient uptake outer membrane protein [Chitinophaga sp. MD30]UCJ08977.1 RagB/SusD family nutrient uptake outer membrane protein [Chitinophaga pendula]
MKKSFLYTSLLLLAISSGCKKYLEKTPDMRTELDSPEKVAELLTSAYPRATYFTFAEAMSDNAEDKGVASSDLVNAAPWFWRDMEFRDLDSPDFYWQGTYKAIAAANHALEAIAQHPGEDAYKPYKGEALLARAYGHFMLVTFFSKAYNKGTAASDPGIPYVTQPEKVVVGKYERKTVAYVYEQIEKDILEGLPLISNAAYKGAPKYHFTVAAANAFATRFYLFKKDYAKVLEHANKAFPGGNILPFLREVNSVAYRSQEPLVKEAEYTKATTKANLLLAEANSVWGRSYFSYRYGPGFKFVQKYLWGDNVTRVSRSDRRGIFGFMLYGREETIRTPKFREHFVKTDVNATFGDPYVMAPLLTAEEVLFNRAEANIELGNYDAALKDLNDYASTRIISNDSNDPNYYPQLFTITEQKIRDFYGTFDLKAGLISSLLDFKRVEFFFEGMRWFDILRHNLPVVHTTFDGRNSYVLGPNDPRRVIQIPQEAQSAGLELNPR